ncbi:MAG: hypothetical protein LBF41_07120 [Deltaproteobacteria bacterium]|jgi:hypothetical protein|nr:hypothetical protein [Deltaproteobacteria bacterium]
MKINITPIYGVFAPENPEIGANGFAGPPFRENVFLAANISCHNIWMILFQSTIHDRILTLSRPGSEHDAGLNFDARVFFSPGNNPPDPNPGFARGFG